MAKFEGKIKFEVIDKKASKETETKTKEK